MSGYYDNINPDLLAMMPLTSRRVLEFGCGSGALARAFRARVPGASYDAVEMHATSADKAREVVDRVVLGNAETLSDDDITNGTQYDLIVMGDVLEHFADPERMLSRCHDWLVPGGHLVLSVPNVAHWIVLEALISGDWPRRDSGLFDRTHRGFFTAQSMIGLLRQAGLEPLRQRPRRFSPHPEKAARWVDALATLAEGMGLDADAVRERSVALQYVTIARKPAPGQVRDTLRVHQSVMAPDFMEARTTVPARALSSEPTLVVTQSVREVVLPAVNGPRVYVLQRPRIANRERLVDIAARVHAAGWVLVIEYDDDPALIARVRRHDEVADIYYQATSVAHAVQTSTEALGALFRQAVNAVGVFPNAVAELTPPRPPRTGPATVVYGALNRLGTADVAAALSPVIAAYPDTRFEVAMDQAFFDALPTHNKVFHGRLSYNDYLAMLGRADVVLSPLEGRPEELGKSDLKWVEAASRGAAMIASPAVYAQTIRDGENGLIAAAPADFARALKRLLDDPVLTAQIAATARAEVAASRMMSHQVAAQRDWYRELWARRDALGADALARNPDLAARIAALTAV